MKDSVTICSVNSGTRLTFSGVAKDAFVVTLEGPSFSGHLIISDYNIGIPPNHFFIQLAADSFGWNDKKGWSSLEGEFGLSAKMDRLGHVFLSVSLEIMHGSDDWKLQAELTLESGQLAALATSLNGLFSEAQLQNNS